MDWSSWLEDGETLRWEGRPAPRCYTFRNWRHALLGSLLLLLSLFWQTVGWHLATVVTPWPALLPLPLVLIAAYLSFGHLLLARLEWERVFYAVTDRRVLALGGFRHSTLRQLPLEHLSACRVQSLGRELASLRLRGAGEGADLRLCCLEYPHLVLPLLEAAIAANSAGEIV